VTLDGFIFQGASTSVVVVESSSTWTHTIKRCLFRNNVASSSRARRGGVVRTATGTRLRIVTSRFVRNRARVGAAISHRGAELTISGCHFHHNVAKVLGIIHLTAGAKADISSTQFVGNEVKNQSQGGAIGAVDVGDAVIRSSVIGRNNTGCSGLFLKEKGRCHPFDDIPFVLGNLTLREHGIALSQGLSLELIARTGHPVQFTSPDAASGQSSLPFHTEPDGAAVFVVDGGVGGGGYVYVSNAEVHADEGGGVYAVEFDASGRIRDYRTLLTNTTWNCNGGRTPWGTWVSCEEYRGGQCWQVDPTGRRPPQRTELGGTDGGHFEAFAYDDRDPDDPRFFVTEDVSDGAVRRYRPQPDSVSGWDALHRPGGAIDYLEFLPDGRTFRWTASHDDGRKSAEAYYPNVEGIVHRGDGHLLFVAKVTQELFDLDLDRMTYAVTSTYRPSIGFRDQPDQLFFFSSTVGGGGDMQEHPHLYFTEDGGRSPGLFAFDGSSFRVLLLADGGAYGGDETTGIDLSPDGRSLFFCVQGIGRMFRLRRLDGLPFEGSHVRLRI